ncbi:MAG: Fur family transcriptional regulator [Acidimicrobiia bacterium]
MTPSTSSGRAEAAERVERLLGELRRAGMRVTVPRRVMIEALVEAGGHVTADDLAETVQATHPGIHRATVYRVLDALGRLGLVEHVHLGHGRALYHLFDDLHPHLYCEECGSVTQAPPRLLAGLARSLQTRFDFEMRPYHFAVVGRCGDCRAVTSGRRERSPGEGSGSFASN